jgi:LysR family glycine cleavage system transcriptional activator
MGRRYYGLPSLTALVVFEASARHLSFKRAASELNVTPGAISKQIKAIEEELGVMLFVRLGVGISLTSAGEDLYRVLASSFSRTAEVIGTIKRGDRSKNVTMACTDSFATFWLIPRMPDFWARFPDVTVDHLISDDTRDFKRAEVELCVRYSVSARSDESGELLFDDLIYPVCGPGFARKHRNIDATNLPELPLLRVDWVNPEWIDWDEVLRRLAIPHEPNRGRRFSKYGVALQAAQADQGVALGWHRIVRHLIEEGRLVRFTTLELPAPGSYYLSRNHHRSLSPAAETLRQWLIEMSLRERKTPAR